MFAPIEREFSAEDVQDLPKVQFEENEKTPGQRLRGVIFVWWDQTGGKDREDKKSFDQFYRETMEKLINWAKDHLK